MNKIQNILVSIVLFCVVFGASRMFAMGERRNLSDNRQRQARLPLRLFLEGLREAGVPAEESRRRAIEFEPNLPFQIFFSEWTAHVRETERLQREKRRNARRQREECRTILLQELKIGAIILSLIAAFDIATAANLLAMP